MALPSAAVALAADLPSPAVLAAFALAVLVLNATPGVDLLLTVQRTLDGGRRAGTAAALGICAGCVVHVAAAASGLAALLAVSAGAFAALKALGAAYLLWLAWGMARAAWSPAPAAPGTPPPPAVRPQGPPARPWRAEFARGFATNVLNPKVALFFVAFLPPFVPAHAARPTLTFALLGAWLIVQSLAFLIVVVAAVDRAARVVHRSRMAVARGRTLARALHGAGALLFAGIAWRLATSRQP